MCSFILPLVHASGQLIYDIIIQPFPFLTTTKAEWCHHTQCTRIKHLQCNQVNLFFLQLPLHFTLLLPVSPPRQKVPTLPSPSMPQQLEILPMPLVATQPTLQTLSTPLPPNQSTCDIISCITLSVSLLPPLMM